MTQDTPSPSEPSRTPAAPAGGTTGTSESAGTDVVPTGIASGAASPPSDPAGAAVDREPPAARVQQVQQLQRWAWLLLLLDAAEQAGLTPLPSSDLHAMSYLANVLAPVYDLPVPNGAIYKYQRGPFYPDLQWDVDRLVVAGLIEMRNYEAVRDRFGAWFTATYVLPATSSGVLDRVLACPRWRQSQEYLIELAAAMGSVPRDVIPAAAFVDATYADQSTPAGELLDFAEWDDRNFSSRAARSFARFVPKGTRLSAREQLHLYVRYLRRAAYAADPARSNAASEGPTVVPPRGASQAATAREAAHPWPEVRT